MDAAVEEVALCVMCVLRRQESGRLAEQEDTMSYCLVLKRLVYSRFLWNEYIPLAQDDKSHLGPVEVEYIPLAHGDRGHLGPVEVEDEVAKQAAYRSRDTHNYLDAPPRSAWYNCSQPSNLYPHPRVPGLLVVVSRCICCLGSHASSTPPERSSRSTEAAMDAAYRATATAGPHVSAWPNRCSASPPCLPDTDAPVPVHDWDDSYASSAVVQPTRGVYHEARGDLQCAFHGVLLHARRGEEVAVVLLPMVVCGSWV